MDEQRALLNNLFGNIEVDDFRDNSVCKYYLCGFCPIQLFENTKIDVGSCDKVHEDKLRIQFMRAQAKTDYSLYYDDFEREILKVKEETDRKIKRSQNKYYDRHDVEMAHVEDNEPVKIINRQIDQMKKRAEAASEQGSVDEAATYMATVEKLRDDKYSAQAKYIMDFASRIPNIGAADGNTKLRVCDICGALLSVVDSEVRLADHFGGRIHQGYLLMQHALKELQERREKQMEEQKIKKESSSKPDNSNVRENTRDGPRYDRKSDRRDDRRKSDDRHYRSSSHHKRHHSRSRSRHRR